MSATSAKPPAVDDDQPAQQNSDLVVRSGFPALCLPAGDKKQGAPNIQDEEPLPRHRFWAMEQALEFSKSTGSLQSLRTDCEAVFSARTRDSQTEAYSAGVTYFLPCQMKPRSALEALVLSIFQKHTADLDPTIFLPEQSGAEWWTLVLDGDDEEEKPASEQKNGDDGDGDVDDEEEEEEEEGDEVGLHFDADYGLEAQAKNLLLHPRLATVTYLSDFGSPTVIFDLASPAPNDTEKKSLAGSVRTGWLSQPAIGKHVAFDGRLLHGAPSTFFPEAHSPSEPAKKKAKQDRKRITLLVNIWLNHCPLDAEPMEDEVIEQLKTPWKEPVFSWNAALDLGKAPTCTKTSLALSTLDPAGSEEVVICGRLVTVNYNASMADFHGLSSQGSLLQLDLNENAVSLEVGAEIEYDSDEEED